MKIFFRSLSLIFLLIFSYFDPTTERRTAFREGKNFGFIEHLDCRIHSPEKVSNVSSQVKYIDRNNIRGIMAMNLSEPVNESWVHGVLYYKYYTYQKIATEYWDDVCAWSAGKRKSFLLHYMKPKFRKYSNFNHSCPYSGLVFAKSDNMSAQELMFPQIIPAGRYKFDVNITGDPKTPLAGFTLYGSVSDHRIEVV